MEIEHKAIAIVAEMSKKGQTLRSLAEADVVSVLASTKRGFPVLYKGLNNDYLNVTLDRKAVNQKTISEIARQNNESIDNLGYMTASPIEMIMLMLLNNAGLAVLVDEKVITFEQTELEPTN